MNKRSIIWAALVAAAPVAFASPPSDGLGGIHVVGQSIDGTLVLDGTRSDLTTWETSGIASVAEESPADAPTLLVVGHVERFDAKTNVLTVSGQAVTLQAETALIDVPRDIDTPLTVDNVPWYLSTGRYIAVAGDSFGEDSNLATHIIRLDNEARPGQVPIYVRGSVQWSDEISGIATVGDVSLDLNSARQEYFPSAGNMVEMLAYRGIEGPAVVADYASVDQPHTRGARLAGISGTGAKAKGISGTGAKGISGTGAKAKGISGTGAKAKGISGTGVKGISGTGAKAKGISGTGVKGISGTGAKTKGISGTGVKGISGTGAKAKGISGTGAKTKGISGTGVKGISGTGAKTKGISGTGIK